MHSACSPSHTNTRLTGGVCSGEQDRSKYSASTDVRAPAYSRLVPTADSFLCRLPHWQEAQGTHSGAGDRYPCQGARKLSKATTWTCWPQEVTSGNSQHRPGNEHRRRSQITPSAQGTARGNQTRCLTPQAAEVDSTSNRQPIQACWL